MLTTNGLLKSGNLVKRWEQERGDPWLGNQPVRSLSSRKQTLSGQPASFSAQHADRFVIYDDDMDSNAATESDLSLKSRSFLHRVTDRVRKIWDQFSKDAMQESD